jgi:Holliday junction resolvasome RuvABC endonuclease subunit
MNVLGIDCGFGSLGWAVADCSNGIIRPILCGVLTTEKSSKKQNVKATEDNIRRAQDLYSGLRNLIESEQVSLIATETMSWPRNAGVVAKMGIAWGVIASVAGQYAIPIIQASPMEIKRKVAGDGKASKERMIQAIQVAFPYLGLPHQLGLQEHAADAVGAIIACQDSELMKWASRAESSLAEKS